MKKSLSHLALIATTLTLLTGCASYNAAPLSNLDANLIQSTPAKGDVTVVAKAFDEEDCKRHLDRDVLKKGYQPVQVYIENRSDKNYFFSLNRINLPTARPDEVANKVHTSTVGRIVGYGIPGLVILWPLLIPAIVDGVKSANANDALDTDFAAKGAKDQTIFAHSRLNTLIFVPRDLYQPNFSITLVYTATNEPKVVALTVRS